MIYNFYCFLLYFMIFSILYPSTLLLVPGKATGSHFSGEVDLLLDMSWDGMREGWSHWKHVDSRRAHGQSFQQRSRFALGHELGWDEGRLEPLEACWILHGSLLHQRSS